MPATELAYGTYWRRKQLIAGGTPYFPVVRCWWLAGVDEVSPNNLRIIATVRDAPAILDIGAGDLRVKGIIERGGFRGEYHTQDIGGEYQHTYGSLDEVRRQYPAILCLDVLEHLRLDDGLAMLHRAAELLEPGGVLVVQTPNALCIRDPMAWDMTHVQTYNAQDLWAFLRVLGLDVEGYRVTLGLPPRNAYGRIKEVVRRKLASLQRVDHAENLVMFARKPRDGAAGPDGATAPALATSAR